MLQVGPASVWCSVHEASRDGKAFRTSCLTRIPVLAVPVEHTVRLLLGKLMTALCHHDFITHHAQQSCTVKKNAFLVPRVI